MGFGVEFNQQTQFHGGNLTAFVERGNPPIAFLPRTATVNPERRGGAAASRCQIKNGPFIPMSVQDETKARRTFGLWRGAREAHTHCGLQRAGNEARGQKDKRIRLILDANWN
jgi:hypothetical protein